ncbi:hypothetical protein BGX21_011505 [Mortierella sp. AD011]|nr:hypothetical protein BGX20_002885 [Mortierella sp. AD010]KAF9402014.1 hypothetical protein BGX21_011505 [Mortierella sp. AD011]
MAKFSNSFNSLFHLSEASPTAKGQSQDLDDHDDDGSKEHTGLLSRSRLSKDGSQDDIPRSNIDTDRQVGNRNMAHSLYASSREPASQRRQTSVPGTPTTGHHGSGTSPLFVNNMSQLWDNDDDDNLDRKSRLTSSMIIEDASPPLPWKEPSHSFESREDLSISKRFSMDAISDGAFAMPSSLPEPHQLSQPAEVPPNIDSNTSVNTPSQPKKRRWGPKGQHKSTPESTMAEDASTQQQQQEPLVADAERLFSSTEAAMQEPITSSFFSDPEESVADSKQSKSSQSRHSSFGIAAFSGSGKGIVSGLSSLRNSIMIPALSSSTTNKAERPISLQAKFSAGSSSLEFSTDGQPQWQNESTPPPRVSSPSLLRSGFLKFGNETTAPGKDFGSASLFSERRHTRSVKDSSNSNSRSASPKLHRTASSPASERRPASVQSSHRSSSRTSRHRFTNQNNAAHSLSLLEYEFQQLVQKQSQLSIHKVELCKELISLYSRRNINEKKQEEAAKMEQFEEADSAATTIRLVQERIQKLEKIYMDTDQALWKCKKRQDELGMSISEMHQAVMKELEQMRRVREQEQEEYQTEMQRMREKEIERIQGEREEVDKEKSDIALGQDFLEKNEAELLERMEEETKAEQEELDDLKEKQNATRAEIQELTRKLEQLNNQDKEYSRGIEVLVQKISTIAQQFDGKAKEVAREKRELERRAADIQHRVLKLERQESNLQKAAQEANAVQDGVRNEIQQITSQQDRLEEVRRLFEEELTTIQKLRLEEEAFREKEAGWNMRSSSLSENLNEHEAKIESLTNASAADQKAITNLELDLEATQKRISTIESLKALSVQRRDFRQASHCSSEIAKCKDTIAQQQSELERLTAKMSGDTHEQLEALQKEYESARAFVIGEEASLFKEIQESTSEILARLSTFSISPASNEDKGAKESAEDDVSAESRNAPNSAMGQLSRLLLSELKSEIEGVQEMSRIQYGREEAVPSMGSHLSDMHRSAEVKELTTTNGSKDGLSAGVDIEEQKHALERDIQAAVAEEDYETAANLQERLDAL